jgi:hypothetical protein
MDVLNTLLGGQGCSTDGSATRNPITSLVDSVFNTHVIDNRHQQLGSFNDNEGYYMEEPAMHQEMQSNFNRDVI